jgi:DNA-binding FadR family transcriptional regulator
LHDQLLEMANHKVAARLIDGLQAQNVRHQFRTVLVPGRAALSVAEHRTIVEAVAAGDADAAEVATRAHLSNVTDALRRAKGAGGGQLPPM